MAAAQGNVGLLNEKGLGVRRDPVEARKWYDRAAAGGDASAARGLERLNKAGE
jgi:TPR repeat protein